MTTSAIDMNEHNRVIIQVESLSRLHNFAGCVVVLDETESLINQLNSSVAKSKDVH